MNLNLSIGPLVALIAGILILVMPRTSFVDEPFNFITLSASCHKLRFLFFRLL